MNLSLFGEITVIDDGFNDFWQAYPKKRNKADALKAWKKLKPSADLQRIMSDSIQIWSNSVDWLKEGGQYIPYPASWLNAHGWEDEPLKLDYRSEKSIRNEKRFQEVTF